MGFLVALGETMFAFVLVMLIMFLLRGVGVKIRGEFGFYVLSGISLFLVHNKIFGALSKSKGSNPMLPIMAITVGMMVVGEVLHIVYMQICVTLIFFLALVIYYGHSPVQDWPLVMYCYLLCIFWSVSIGLFFMSIDPLMPTVVTKVAAIYRRIGMITSGKMIPGNMMAMMGRFGGIFFYNPLFHIIDQMRGGVFRNYTPNSSNLIYPLKTTAIFFAISAVIYFAFRKK